MLYITNRKDISHCVFLDSYQHERKFDLIKHCFSLVYLWKNIKDLSSSLRLIKRMLNFLRTAFSY
ncbi:hypothetical protein Patl1_31303 [Pistacia atlantica]|uniref:Uncharacterized protein n=1 Tax=Pistacia atlantica TaxID=434234 RepID=A0ACC1AA51_9ROSI|nr:hypothetical protein Patl1_31303 [Pistacia atlantica]